MVKQLIMKIRNRFILLALVSCLFLTACEEDSGFGIVRRDNDYQEPENTMGERTGEERDDTNSNSGATGSKDDDQQQNENPATDPVTGEGGEGPETPVVDIGNHIVSFSISFESSPEANYINFSYVEDPFDAKYNFAYYTVNDARLDKCEYCLKETVNEKDTYRIYVGQNKSANYVLKFYNKSGVQYGKAYVSVKLDSEVKTTSYISVAFNLVRVRFLSITYSVQNVFKKIGDFFSNLFNGDRISL